MVNFVVLDADLSMSGIPHRVGGTTGHSVHAFMRSQLRGRGAPSSNSLRKEGVSVVYVENGRVIWGEIMQFQPVC